MGQFFSTDLADRTGDVLAAAARNPVSIAGHGKPRFIVLSTEQFQMIEHGLDNRSSHHVSELGDDEAARLVAARGATRPAGFLGR